MIDLAAGVSAIQVFKAHDGWIDGIALDPTGRWLATAGRDKKVKLWQPDRSHERSVTLAEDDEFVLAWSSDGRLLAAGGEAGVKMWLMPEAQPLGHPVTSLGTAIFGLAFATDSTMLVANGGQGLAVLINADAATNPSSPVETQLVNVGAIDFSSDGHRLALGGCTRKATYGCGAGGIEIWDLSGARPALVAQTTVGTDSIAPVRFLSDSRHVRGALESDGAVFSWDSASNTPPVIQRLTPTVRGIVKHYTFLGPNAQTVAVGGCGRFRDTNEIYCDEGRLELWDAERGVRTGGPWAVHHEEVNAAAIDSTGKRMATGGGDGEVVIWDRIRGVPTSPPLRSGIADANTGSEAGIELLTFSPDNRWLVGGSQQGLVIWDVGNRQVASSIRRNWSVSSLAFTQDSRRIAFNGASKSGDAMVWDLVGRTNAFPPFGPLTTVSDIVAMTGDGAWLAAADRNARVVVWHLSTDEPDARACQVLGRSFTREQVAQLVAGEPVGELCPSVR